MARSTATHKRARALAEGCVPRTVRYWEITDKMMLLAWEIGFFELGGGIEVDADTADDGEARFLITGADSECVYGVNLDDEWADDTPDDITLAGHGNCRIICNPRSEPLERWLDCKIRECGISPENPLYRKTRLASQRF